MRLLSLIFINLRRHRIRAAIHEASAIMAGKASETVEG